MVFDGLGGVTGVLSQVCKSRPSGVEAFSRAAYPGTYIVNSDGSATLDICITLPSPSTETVRAIFEGSFSARFANFRYVQTQVADPCSGTLQTQPNVTSGTAEKL
jgi:hypothetical protein